MAKKATPKVHENRFLKAGGTLTDEQWENMTPHTRQMFLNGVEIRKPKVGAAALKTFAAKEKKKP